MRSGGPIAGTICPKIRSGPSADRSLSRREKTQRGQRHDSTTRRSGIRPIALLRIELDVSHDGDVGALIEAATTAAKAAIRDRGAGVWGCTAVVVDQPTWLYRTARDIGCIEAARTTTPPAAA